MDTPTFPYPDEELDEAGLRGEGVAESVEQALNTMRKRPDLLNLSLFTLQCMNFAAHQTPASPVPPPDPPILSIIPSDATPYAPSDWERINYYNGISSDPPELLYRSNLLQNPFPIPKDGHTHLTKSIHGVHNTPLNPVWPTVAPQICSILRTRKIPFSSMNPVRCITHGEDGRDTLGPIVIWIGTPPATTTAKNAHDASLPILALLEANGVEGAVVEWIESVVQKLLG